MPLLLNVLQNANTPEYKKLRVKAMECAGLIGRWNANSPTAYIAHDFGSAIAVGRDIFRPDSAAFVEALMRIQSEYTLVSPLDLPLIIWRI